MFFLSFSFFLSCYISPYTCLFLHCIFVFLVILSVSLFPSGTVQRYYLRIRGVFLSKFLSPPFCFLFCFLLFVLFCFLLFCFCLLLYLPCYAPVGFLLCSVPVFLSSTVSCYQFRFGRLLCLVCCVEENYGGNALQSEKFYRKKHQKITTKKFFNHCAL